MSKLIIEKVFVEKPGQGDKTGCQWRQLPMKQFFRCKYKHLLDLSIIQFDGTHIPTKRSGEAVAYPGQKKAKTSNMLILTDNQGIPLTFNDAIDGNHNDTFYLVPTTQKMITGLEVSEIRADGLFLDPDSGFDTEEFRAYCSGVEIIGNINQNKRNKTINEYLFDDLLYECRFVVEQTNAWLNAFRTILVRFETNAIHWKALNLLAFIVIILCKL